MGKKLSGFLVFSLVLIMISGSFCHIQAEAAAKAKLSSSKKTLFEGELFSLELSNAKGEVKWSSSNKKVAVVESGTVTAVKKGKEMVIPQIQTQ